MGNEEEFGFIPHFDFSYLKRMKIKRKNKITVSQLYCKVLKYNEKQGKGPECNIPDPCSSSPEVDSEVQTEYIQAR